MADVSSPPEYARTTLLMFLLIISTQPRVFGCCHKPLAESTIIPTQIAMTKSQNLWGGRFQGKPDSTFTEFNNSFRFDLRLFTADIQASIAHAEALQTSGVLTARETEKIRRGLIKLVKMIAADGSLLDSVDAEDVHSFIEAKLVELIGDTARKLHTGRSRN